MAVGSEERSGHLGASGTRSMSIHVNVKNGTPVTHWGFSMLYFIDLIESLTAFI